MRVIIIILIYAFAVAGSVFLRAFVDKVENSYSLTTKIWFVIIIICIVFAPEFLHKELAKTIARSIFIFLSIIAASGSSAHDRKTQEKIDALEHGNKILLEKLKDAEEDRDFWKKEARKE